MFENKTYEGIHYSRFAASWRMACEKVGERSYFYEMVEWLMSLTINGKKMDETTAREIADFAHNGKLELEISAKNWISKRVAE